MLPLVELIADPRTLVIDGNQIRLTDEQARAQFTLWSIFPTNLLISQNVLTWSPYALETYSNAELIAVNGPIVALRKKDDASLLNVPRATLCREDQDYIDFWAAAHPEMAAQAPAAPAPGCNAWPAAANRPTCPCWSPRYWHSRPRWPRLVTDHSTAICTCGWPCFRHLSNQAVTGSKTTCVRRGRR